MAVGLPTKLLIERNNTSYTIYSIVDGLKTHKTWGFLPDDEANPIHKHPPEKTPPLSNSNGTTAPVDQCLWLLKPTTFLDLFYIFFVQKGLSKSHTTL